MPDTARRGFLRGAFLDPEARAAERRRRQPLGPPPPWIADQVVASQCADCAGFCVEACPEAIVARHPAGHRLAGVPWLDFVQAGCTFCGGCAQACPAAERAPTVPAIGVVRLDTSRCHAWNGVVCMSCLRYCGQHALTRGEGFRVSLDTARCNGCGACVSPCPGDALHVDFTAITQPA